MSESVGLGLLVTGCGEEEAREVGRESGKTDKMAVGWSRRSNCWMEQEVQSIDQTVRRPSIGPGPLRADWISLSGHAGSRASETKAVIGLSHPCPVMLGTGVTALDSRRRRTHSPLCPDRKPRASDQDLSVRTSRELQRQFSLKA